MLLQAAHRSKSYEWYHVSKCPEAYLFQTVSFDISILRLRLLRNGIGLSSNSRLNRRVIGIRILFLKVRDRRIEVSDSLHIARYHFLLAWRRAAGHSNAKPFCQLRCQRDALAVCLGYFVPFLDGKNRSTDGACTRKQDPPDD